jgi:hypothetical protein
LPIEAERGPASFEHAGPDDVPVVAADGATVRLLVGTGFGAAAPIGGASPLFHADVELAPGAHLALPPEHAERAVLVISGEVDVDGQRVPHRHLAVIAAGDGVVTASTSAQVMAFGGAPVGRRFIWWNFVASTEEQIEEAKADWAAGRFAPIPDDAGAPVPLPAAGG